MRDWTEPNFGEHLTNGAIHDGWRLPLLSREQFMEREEPGRLSREQLRYLAWFGLLAPSTHNTVPQRFVLRAEVQRIEVFADRRYVLAESDPSGRQCLVSLGCTLANVQMAAAVMGFNAQVEFSRLERGKVAPIAEGIDGERYVPAFAMTFSSTDRYEEERWLELMRSRKVLRAEYDRSVSLTEDAETRLHQIVESTQRMPGELQLHLVKGALALKAIAKFQEQADRFVLESRQFARELGDWLLPNQDSSSTRGMRGREFGFDDEFSAHVHEGLRGQRQLLPDQLAAFAKGGKVGLESSSAVLVVSINSDDPTLQVRAGCAAQLVTLELSRRGFQSAYHAALTEVDWAASMFAASILHTRRRPTVILRCGKAKRAIDLERPHASRPSIDDVILDR
ncbi:MAG: hypothetical protein RL033_5232 [Pseudomonadota bacterium]|jgi:hypothetical protein